MGSVSLTPSLCIRRSEVDRIEGIAIAIPIPAGLRESTDVPCRDPVHRVRVVGDVNTPIRQLLTKSYRPGTGRPRRRGQAGEPGGERLGTGDQRLPEPLSPRRV